MNVGIIGLGLIGGSFGRAVLAKTEHKVFGYDISEATMLKAEMLGAMTAPLNKADMESIDLLVVALCPQAACAALDEYVPLLRSDAIVMDCCGTKREIVSKMRDLSERYEVGFVGVHPMAGREYSGISHSTVGLFEHAYFVMTPVSASIEQMLSLKELFLSLGADGVEYASSARHDEMIAFTSQLAHVISSAYAQCPHAIEHAGFSAGSFRDLTRVARLNPDMWTELFLENKDNLTTELDCFIGVLERFRSAISNGDASDLHDILENGTVMKEIAEKQLKARKKNE